MRFQPTPETCLTLDLIEELIARTPVFEGEQSVGEVFDRLRSFEGDFFGILETGRYMGVISKAQIAMLLSGRFGYALYAKYPIGEHLLKDAHVVTPGDAPLDVLDRALSRKEPEFHHDLAVVDAERCYLDMLSTPTLVRLQNAASAKEALEKLETIACDPVISDVRLPGMNGMDLLCELRRRSPRLAERFFFITGDAGATSDSSSTRPYDDG